MTLTGWGVDLAMYSLSKSVVFVGPFLVAKRSLSGHDAHVLMR